MPTVGELIKQLQKRDPDEPIVYQYLLCEPTDISIDDFEQASEYLADSGAFGEYTSEILNDYIIEALSDLEQENA
jgi:hypothetical protein